ncbi:hypothetical protein, partial [Klebsiella pneumoniae]|uniref:hypothetical protein n=1 Tax=Klebsiella pneumoniae TaxID=573 RepID=UPI0030132BB0
SQGRLTLSQGSAALGRSSFQQLDGSVDFRSGLRRLRYKLKLAGTLDLEETYQAAIQTFPALQTEASKHVQKLAGNAAVRATTSGTLN